jgi:2',3'-cyclic-nucleotide 2'-phosphodiesterase (5'-nucleotidase family)
VVDTGDALIGGGLLGDATQGEVIVAGMNLMGYDAMALGPFELSLGLDVLRQRMTEAEFPMLSANAVLSGTEDLVAPPYAILRVGDHRVGVVGLTRQPAAPLAGFQVLDPQQAAARVVPEVADQADTILVLTNMEYRSAIALAGAVPGIDLLVAALPGQLPMQALRLPGTGTLVVTAEQPVLRHTGRRIGRLVVTVQPDGSLTGESWTSDSMGTQYADDLQMTALLSEYRPGTEVPR